jgi:patatin-like phospholipase/acyl hydrolase
LQILCLSGGGYLGFYTASILAKLEEYSGRPLADCFDLIAGTSVGGILALGLAARTPAAVIRDAMREHGPKIFRTSPPPQSKAGKRLALFSNAMSAKYSAAPLRAIIDDLVDPAMKVGDLSQRIIVPAVNLTKGRPQVFKTPHHPTFVRDLRLLVADVALATSAAPTYFPLHNINGELFADGGLYANAPDQLALHEAEHFLGAPLEDITMLSIGTTTSKFSFSNSVDPNMGWMAWMEDERLPSVMISTQQINASAILEHRLAQRYLRIDHDQSKEQERFLGLDVASSGAISDLQGLAEASVRDHLGKATLPAMLAKRASPPTFYNPQG